MITHTLWDNKNFQICIELGIFDHTIFTVRHAIFKRAYLLYTDSFQAAIRAFSSFKKGVTNALWTAFLLFICRLYNLSKFAKKSVFSENHCFFVIFQKFDKSYLTHKKSNIVVIEGFDTWKKCYVWLKGRWIQHLPDWRYTSQKFGIFELFPSVL